MTLTAEFKINRNDYGMTYGAGKIDDDVAGEIRQLAIRAFRAIDGQGLARVDDDHTVGQAAGLAQVVRDQQHGHGHLLAPGGQLAAPSTAMGRAWSSRAAADQARELYR